MNDIREYENELKFGTQTKLFENETTKNERTAFNRVQKDKR